MHKVLLKSDRFGHIYFAPLILSGEAAKSIFGGERDGHFMLPFGFCVEFLNFHCFHTTAQTI